MIIKESTERNDKNNWVKRRLIDDNFKIVEFEGFTIKANKVTGLFDRRMFKDIDFEILSTNEVLLIIEEEEENLSQKIAFAESLDVYYRYVFYSYEPRLIYVYRFEEGNLVFKKKYGDYCDFIAGTKGLRDLTMSSPLQESGMPQIDHIFRNECSYAWMGNLDGLFISTLSGESKILVEFQTTIKDTVEVHCNNKYFASRNGRKGDEQRWKVADILSKHATLPYIIIVWSPNEVEGDIKYKVIDKIVYSDDTSGESVGLHYSTKEIIDYVELKVKLNSLIS